MTVLADHRTPTADRPMLDSVLSDGLPRQAAGPRFRFAQPNPAGVAGRTYAQSLFVELPYMVGVLVRRDLRLTEAEWDGLVCAGVCAGRDGPGGVPGAVHPRRHRLPAGPGRPSRRTTCARTAGAPATRSTATPQ